MAIPSKVSNISFIINMKTPSAKKGRKTETPSSGKRPKIIRSTTKKTSDKKAYLTSTPKASEESPSSGSKPTFTSSYL